MSSLNQVNLIGRVGRDPELRSLSNGDAVCNLSLATSETWKDKDGEKQESTEWHRVTLFKRQAEVAAEYAKKGALIFVSGKLKTRKWQDKDGKDAYTTEVHAFELKLLGSKPDGDRAPAPAPRAAAPAPKAQQRGNDFDSDVPF